MINQIIRFAETLTRGIARTNIGGVQMTFQYIGVISVRYQFNKMTLIKLYT